MKYDEYIRRNAPESGRRFTMCEAMIALYESHKDYAQITPTILEVGAARNPSDAARESDGWSTRMWAWYAYTFGAHVITIDPSPRSIRNAKKIVGRPLGDFVTFVQADARKVVHKYPVPDLLYLDGPKDAVFHRDVFERIEEKGTPRLVLFDDTTLEEWGPKAAALAPVLENEGWRILFRTEQQTLFKRPES